MVESALNANELWHYKINEKKTIYLAYLLNEYKKALSSNCQESINY